MEDNYISNISEGGGDIDEEMLLRVNQLEIDNEKLKNELKDVKKENLDYKHRVQDFEIELAHNEETIKNQNGLIKFYKQYRTEHEDDIEKKKISEYEEKIKSLEESVAIKQKKIEMLNTEIKEQSALNEKLVDVITSKEETIRKMEKGGTDQDNRENISKLEEEIENLKGKISDLENDKDKITDKYEDKIKDLNKENNDYQDKIYDLETEILNLKDENKKFEIEKVKKEGGPDAEKEVEKLYKDEIENLQKVLNEAKESKKQIKEKAQEQRESDLKEIMDLEKALEDVKNELEDLKKEKLALENSKKDLKETNLKLIKRNKELETILGDNNDKDAILNNFKMNLDKKNNEIENLTAKCKEFKENLDQYEEEKENTLKKIKHEKEILESEVEDKKKKLEVALRELNELRAKEGKEEANMQQMMDDPKQKLYDEIKEKKSELEKLTKENTMLKNKVANFEIDTKKEIEAQTQYLNSTIEGLNKNIEQMKKKKEEASKDYKDQIGNLEIEISNLKCQLATLQYDSDKKLITYKKYVTKLQKKLESLGFKFKDKKSKSNKTIDRFNTIV